MANWISSGDSLRLLCWHSCPSYAPLFAGLCEFGVAQLEDFLVSAGEFVGGCDVADCAVQADVVVVMHIVADESAGVVERQGRAWPDAFGLESFVIAFELAVALWVIG